MTNISKAKIPKDEYVALYKEFAKTISKLDSQSSFYFLNELLTYSERVMLIKRFSAILMFHSGHSAYSVWNKLKISPTTAQKIYNEFEKGSFDRLLNTIKPHQRKKIWELLELLIAAQVSPKAKAKLMDKASR